MIYYNTIKHDRIVDSRIIKLKSIGVNELGKNIIVEQFKYAKTDLKNKLRTMTEFNTTNKIDSLLKPSVDLEIFPKFAIVSELQSGKLNATKAAELLLKNLNEKTKNESELNR